MEYFEEQGMMDNLLIIDVDADKEENQRKLCQLKEFLDHKEDESEGDGGNGTDFPHKNKRSKFFLIYAGMLAFLMYDRGLLSVTQIQIIVNRVRSVEP